ncbi:hypothetical protein ScPMuIL_016926 [Solemya velum]
MDVRAATTGYTTSIICEHNRGTISCPGASISIASVNYGRTDYTTCRSKKRKNTNTNTKTCTLDVTSDVRNACDGKTACHVDASNDKYSGDPCLDVYKYLNVTHTCLAKASATSAPRGSTVHVVTTAKNVPEINIAGKYNTERTNHNRTCSRKLDGAKRKAAEIKAELKALVNRRNTSAYTNKKISASDERDEDEMPWYPNSVWVLFNVANSASLATSILYWALLYGPILRNRTTVVSWITKDQESVMSLYV